MIRRSAPISSSIPIYGRIACSHKGKVAEDAQSGCMTARCGKMGLLGWCGIQEHDGAIELAIVLGPQGCAMAKKFSPTYDLCQDMGHGH